jgi:hypothetical protein
MAKEKTGLSVRLDNPVFRLCSLFNHIDRIRTIKDDMRTRSY